MIRKLKLSDGILVVSITLALMMRMFLGILRYFDPDEFAHFHWAFHFIIGQKPYHDFFIYHIPFYQWFLLPLFLLPQGPGAVIAARLLMFSVFGASLIAVYFITKKISRNTTTGLFAVFIASIFPIMIDKSIEIRPDMLMVLLYLIPLTLLVRKQTETNRKAFIAGFILGLCVMVYQKILFAVPALVLLFLWEPLKSIVRKQATTIQSTNRIVRLGVMWTLGGMIPMVAFFIYLAAAGILPDAMSLIIEGTRAAYSDQSVKFSPFLALSPWPLVYLDRGGPSLPWALNIVLLLTIVGGIVILAWQRNWKYCCYYLLFYVSSYAYLLLFPTPFVQYYLPVVTVGSTLSAIFITTLIGFFNKLRLVIPLTVVFLTIGLVSYYQQYAVRTNKDNTNTEQMQVVSDVVTHIKPEESVYDMVGSYAFRPPGFAICCLHYFVGFAQTLEKDHKLIPITDSLVKNQTKFLVLDRNGYVFWLVPEPDMTFLRTNYIPSAYHKIYSVGYKFSCASGTCTRLNLDDVPLPQLPTNSIPVFIPETYRVTTVPPGGSATIGNKQVRDGEIISLATGPTTLYVSNTVTKITIQLDR